MRTFWTQCAMTFSPVSNLLSEMLLFCNEELAHVHGCQIAQIEQNTGQKSYSFNREALIYYMKYSFSFLN